MIEDIIVSICELGKVSSESAEAYAQARDKLLMHLLAHLKSNPDIIRLIGVNSFDLILNKNHRHAALMATVFRSNDFELLVRTSLSEYRAYGSRGFSSDYFPAELQAWYTAVDECLEHPTQKAEIQAVYSWMIRRHKDIIELLPDRQHIEFPVRTESYELQQLFQELLLRGDNAGCLQMVDQVISTTADLKRFYLEAIWPSMYRIGQLWESNQVTIAEQFLATAIVSRVMASLYQRFAEINITQGKVVVSAAANDFHELGARMVGDFMEMDGWDVHYMGKNNSAEELLGVLKKQKPFALALSVATVFHLSNVHQVIQMIRNSEDIRNLKILVGGSAFTEMPDLWQNVGADGYAADAESAVQLVNGWWSQGAIADKEEESYLTTSSSLGVRSLQHTYLGT